VLPTLDPKEVCALACTRSEDVLVAVGRYIRTEMEGMGDDHVHEKGSKKKEKGTGALLCLCRFVYVCRGDALQCMYMVVHGHNTHLSITGDDIAARKRRVRGLERGFVREGEVQLLGRLVGSGLQHLLGGVCV